MLIKYLKNRRLEASFWACAAFFSTALIVYFCLQAPIDAALSSGLSVAMLINGLLPDNMGDKNDGLD